MGARNLTRDDFDDPAVWDRMTPTERRAANRDFRDEQRREAAEWAEEERRMRADFAAESGVRFGRLGSSADDYDRQGREQRWW